MDAFVPVALRFIDRYSFIFYAVSVVGILYYLLQARGAGHQLRYTPFPIEREEAKALRRDALALMLVFVAILAATFSIDRILAPNSAPVPVEEPALPETPVPDSETGQSRPQPTARAATVTATSPAIAVRPSTTLSPTVGPTRTPRPTRTATTAPTVEGTPGTPLALTGTPATLSPTLSPAASAAASAAAIATAIPTQPPPATATLPPTQPPPPTAVPPPTEPPPPSVPPANCPTAGIYISSPANGAVVSGAVGIFGTTSIDRFQFYKVEVGAGAPAGSLTALGDIVRTPVLGGQLATWNTNGYGSGLWTIRLTVVDETGNFPSPCNIYVVIP